LLEYNSQSTHMRAAVIGLLNTLLVAVMGCALATFIGVFVGVLRLSKNWIISRLALVYVETFRNVPVLLWISLAVVAFSHTLPSPRDFRGANATASMNFFDSVAITNRGVYLPEPLFSSGLGDLPVFWNSFEISLDLIAILCVFISGILLSKLIKYRATNIQNATGVRPTTWYWSLAAIFLPTLIVLYILGFYLGYPEIKGFNFKGGIHMRSSLLALVRAGILAISKGQTEAAESLGLRSKRIMGLVVLPQAMRVIVPPLISQYLNLTKNSSLAVVAGYMDITQTLGGVTMNQTGREMESILLLMMCYLIISLIISGVMNVYNERTKLKER
ncbi:MAG: amino acid ABC transporter permease, partial [Rhodobacterales bacterium]